MRPHTISTVRRAQTRAASALLAAMLVSTIFLMGCSGSKPPEETPGVTGEIKEFRRVDSGTVIATMLVEGGPQPHGAVSDKAMVSLTEETRIFSAEGERIEIGEFEDAASDGATASVWFTGPVAESYPVQGTAKAVQLTD